MRPLWYPSVEELLALHAELVRRTTDAADPVTPSLLRRGALEAAIDRARRGRYVGGTDVADRAAFLLRGIAQDHPFVDGNKRAALGAVDAFLLKNGWNLAAAPEETHALVLAAADARHAMDVEEMAAWLRARLRKVHGGR